jgi:Co/Zn/Cd efflux system component
MVGRRSPEARRAVLDERVCRLICPIAAAMVGVCLTGIGLLRVAFAMHGTGTIADDLLSIDAVLFLLATLTSYFALRVQSNQRLHGLERVADGAFIIAMLLLTVACFVITYALNR